MKNFAALVLGASVFAQQRFLSDDEDDHNSNMRKMCFSDDPTDCVMVPVSSDPADSVAESGNGDGTLAWRDDLQPPKLMEEEQDEQFRGKLLCNNPADSTDCVRVPTASDGKPVKNVDRDGNLDWQDQEDHPMVLGGDGTLDAKDLNDHPMVKDGNSGSANGDGSLDWKSQDDHPMVKDPSNGSGTLDWKS